MSTGLLRARTSRRSKTKSPYVRPPASTTGPSAQPTREPALIQHAGSGSQDLSANSSGLQVSSEVNSMDSTLPQLQQTSTAPATTNVAYQPGTCIPVNPLVSITADLGANIPLTTQEKIWNNEYIDLAKLLHLDPAAEIQQLLVFEDGEIKIKNKSKDKKIVNISEWTDSFLIYAAIYLKKFPQHVQGILKYISSIRLGASRSTTLGWRDYDIQFRLRRSKNSLISWENIDAELWLIYMGQATVAERKPTSTLHQHRRCYDFNLKGSCLKKDCRYLHSCLKCEQNHPSIKCYSNQTSHNTPKGASHMVGRQNINPNVTQSRFSRPFRQ